MIIDFKSWSNNRRMNAKDRVYITVDGKDAGFIGRETSNTSNRDNAEQYPNTINSELFQTLVEIMEQDLNDFCGPDPEGMRKDNFYFFNMFNHAGGAFSHNFKKNDRKNGMGQFIAEYENGIDID